MSCNKYNQKSRRLKTREMSFGFLECASREMHFQKNEADKIRHSYQMSRLSPRTLRFLISRTFIKMSSDTIQSDDSCYDSDDSLVTRINSVLRSLAQQPQTHTRLGLVTKSHESPSKKPISSPKTDTPTLRNVQMLLGIMQEQGFVNENGSPLPITSHNLAKYIFYQTRRMEAGQLSLSSLNWYLQSLRRYCLDTGAPWESIRQHEQVKMAMMQARKVAQAAKKRKDQLAEEARSTLEL